MFSYSRQIVFEMFNFLWLCGTVSDSWLYFHMISIHKPNTFPCTYRPIALSLVLCKIVQYMLKEHLDWYIERDKFIPDNHFGFQRGLSILECFSAFVSNIYQSFCDKEHLSVAFIDIKGTLDSVYISTVISCLIYLHIPHSFCNFILSLFSRRFLIWSSPFGFTALRETFRGLL